jgi:hypothetical protein
VDAVNPGRGRIVKHKTSPLKRDLIGTVLGQVLDLRKPPQTWLVIAWDNGIVSCSKPGWVEPLDGGA